MDSPTDTMEAKANWSFSKEDVGFQNTMTNLFGKLSRTLGFGYNPSKVNSVNWTDYTSENLVYSKGMLHIAVLAEDPSDSEKYNHEILIYYDKQDKMAFSLLRTKSLKDSEAKICHFQEIFPCLVESRVKDIYTTSVLQKVLDAVTSWESYKSSHIAVCLGLCEALKHDTVKRCLEEPEEKCGSYPIHIAVETGNEKIIEAVLSCGISLEVTDSMGNTPMHIAASKSVTVIQTLLPLHLKKEKNTCLNRKNSYNESPLTLAAKVGKMENIKALIVLGANLNHDDNVHPEFETVQYLEKLKLLEVSKDFSNKDLKFGGTLLHWAKTREAINLSIDLGCKVDLLNDVRETPLHVMVREDRMSCAVMLLSLGATPNVCDNDGNTPLHLAAKSLSVPFLQALISFGADVLATNNNKESPRHVASTVTVDPRCITDREKAIFVLHAVGAKRCHKKLSSCNQGCLLSGLSNGIPLVSQSPLQRSRWVFDDYLSQFHVSEAIKEQNKSTPSIRGRILCLDGGGIKGLVLCQQLAVIESFIGVPIHECFDWITGTSTGAYFALNLAMGRPIEHTQGTYFRLKDKIFVGMRPYDSGPLEDLLKEEFGHDTMMSSIKKVKVNLPTTLADRIPADLHIFRNYESPIDILGITQNDSFVIPPAANKQLIWQAARASGAAPTFFRLPDKFVDGGLIANNPVLDTLTEIEERNMALKATGKGEEMFHPTVVVSIGCGKQPTSQVSHIDLVMPSLLDMRKGMTAASNMILMLVDQACSTEERTVDRARAWCSTTKLPYFRFNPNMSQMCSLDECNDEKLVNMMWEARAYTMNQSSLLTQLKTLLVPAQSE